MKLEHQLNLLVGGYYGITYLDEYSLKEYLLKDIEGYIRDFVLENPIENFDYYFFADKYEKELSEKEKLQNSLIILNKIKASMDVVLLVKKHIKMLENNEKEKEL